ncbi:chorismate mutase [Roseibium sp.]|uniref:chorismate mutase n=1 Tax=Roseibium sp. TaxID=1936156 RepID=UPI003B521891
MPPSPDSGASRETARARIDDIDARIHEAVLERNQAAEQLRALQSEAGLVEKVFDPDRDAEVMRHLAERHHSDLPLTTMEAVWRSILSAGSGLSKENAVHLDGTADLVGMLDLARYYFGFSVELVPGSDAADVAGAVTDSASDIGLVALSDRTDLPWWRGLSDSGAQIRARLPFVVMEERPADLPALVLAKSDSMIDKPDIAVYDARWSDRLPGRLMDQGIEVLSFYRSANGVDALLAVSGDLPEDAVLAACLEAGAAPDVLRCIGGYAAPIDGGSDPEDVFDPAENGDLG